MMKISEIRDILDATVLHVEELLDTKIVAGGAADLMEDVLAAAAKGCVLLTGVTTDHVVRTAKIVGIGALVVVRGKRPPNEFVDMARTYNIPLLQCKHSLFVACGKLYMNGIRGLDGSW